MNKTQSPLHTLLRYSLALLTTILLVAQLSFDPAYAQAEDDENRPVQVVLGSLDSNQMTKYLVPGLSAGDVLYVYGDGVSGNLDPFVGVANYDVTLAGIEAEAAAAIQEAAASGADPVVAIEAALEEVFLASDDDGGSGYDAALSFRVPHDGDYALVVRSSYGRSTFGDYRLLIGINEPGVLTGEAEPTGDTLIVLDQDNQRGRAAVEEISGTLSPQTGFEVFRLKRFAAGDSLYVYLQVLVGDLRPLVMLQDFVGKSIRAASGSDNSATVAFEYTFPEDAQDYQLILSPGRAAESESASYRLLVGANAPDVLTGSASPTERRVISVPTEVSTWLDLDQVSAVDQRNESFTVVGSLYMRWNDPARAFRPDDCGCAFKTYLGDDFSEFTRTDQGLTWPEYVIFNQQGERLTQARGRLSPPTAR